MYLNAHTYFSLRYGTLSVSQLVQAAVACGLRQLALTDINNTNAALFFICRCRKVNIHLMVSSELRYEYRLLYICLARNAKGFC